MSERNERELARNRGRARLPITPAALERKTRAVGGTDRDVAEVLAFQRFLRAADRQRIPRGWVPYILGRGPAPPPELEDVAVTAWTLPG